METGPPELDEGAEDEPPRLPLELLDEPELEEPELELEEPEPDEPELDEPELEEPELEEPELELEPEPEDDVPELLLLPDVDELPVVVEPLVPVVLCVEPGRLRATAPAAARLAKLTAAVVALSR